MRRLSLDEYVAAALQGLAARNGHALPRTTATAAFKIGLDTYNAVEEYHARQADLAPSPQPTYRFTGEPQDDYGIKGFDIHGATMRTGSKTIKDLAAEQPGAVTYIPRQEGKQTP
jgi:hypothetical protein